MLVFDLGIYAVFRHYEPEKSSAATQPLTLKNLFDTDFPSGSVSNTITMKSVRDGTIFSIPYRVVTDFTARTKFIAFYVPSSPSAFDICCALPPQIQTVFDAIEKSIEITATDSGNAPTTLKDLAFTGRSFIYCEDNFSFLQLATIESAFSERNTAVQFRGQTYWVLHCNDKRELPNPAPAAILAPAIHDQLPSIEPPPSSPTRPLSTEPSTTLPAGARPTTKPFALLRPTTSLVECLQYAAYGEGPLDETDQWRDVTEPGEELINRVKRLIRQFEPVEVNWRNLQIPESFLHGTVKKLNLFTSKGLKATFRDGEQLTIELLQQKLKPNPDEIV